MEAFIRTIRRIARIFDGTTPETMTGYTTRPSENFLLTVKSDVENVVGSFSTRDLSSADAQRPLAVWFRLVGEPQPDSVLNLRSAASEAGASYPSLLLNSYALTTDWQGPIVVGATDRLCPVHDSGAASAIEYMVIDAVNAAQLGLIKDITSAPATNCCSSASITVTDTGGLSAWGVDTLYVFVNAPAAPPKSIQMPLLANLAIGKSAVFIRIGGGLVYVGPQGAEKMNGQSGYAFELDSFCAVRVTRREDGYVATKNTLWPGTLITNAVANFTVALPTPAAPVTEVRLDITERTLLRLPATGDWAVGCEMPLVRGNGRAPAVIFPQAGELLNGRTNGTAHLGSKDAAVLRKTTYGIIIVGSHGLREPEIIEVPAGNATIPNYAGELVVRFTEAAAQAGTLPLAAECEPYALLIIEALGGAKTINRAGADVINGKVGSGAVAIGCAAGVNLYLRPNPAGFWVAM